MNLFEPLFLLLAAATLVALILVAVRAIRGELARAGRLLLRVAAVAAVYFAIVIVVSASSPRRVYHVGDQQCFDDWCIAVTSAARTPLAGGGEDDVRVILSLSSRARRVPMGEKGTVVYLTDAGGRRFNPEPGAAVPLDVVLQPGERVEAERHFRVPSWSRDLGLVYTHEGGFPIGWLIITEGGWFQA